MINKTDLRFTARPHDVRPTVILTGSMRLEMHREIDAAEYTPEKRQRMEEEMRHRAMQVAYGEVRQSVQELRQRVASAIHAGGDWFDVMCKFDDLLKMID